MIQEFTTSTGARARVSWDETTYRVLMLLDRPNEPGHQVILLFEAFSPKKFATWPEWNVVPSSTLIAEGEKAITQFDREARP